MSDFYGSRYWSDDELDELKGRREPICPACGASCLYKYCDERARNAEFAGNDDEFLRAYRAHAERLKGIA